MLYKIETVRQICLDAGADAAGFVEIDRPALASERNDIRARWAQCTASD